MPIDQRTYKVLLSTRRWEDFRYDFIRRHGRKCDICGNEFVKGLQVHHKVYYEGWSPWDYRDEDLMCLCVDCHRKLHLDLAQNGERIPVLKKEKQFMCKWDSSFCRHCEGFGFLEEFHYIMGGLCLYCFGTGLSGVHRYSDFEIQKYAQMVYHDWLTYHESHDDNVDPYKFTSEKDVENWLRQINGPGDKTLRG